jgi:hypothetical protein
VVLLLVVLLLLPLPLLLLPPLLLLLLLLSAILPPFPSLSVRVAPPSPPWSEGLFALPAVCPAVLLVLPVYALGLAQLAQLAQP